MKKIDVFNGDADGLCALMQWRREYPADAMHISGVKRDNALLRRVKIDPGTNSNSNPNSGPELLVLDINFENNRADVERLLAAGASIRYFDHHYAGERIEHPRLELTVDESPAVCTSLLVHRALHGQQVAWAVTGAFGDNLPGVATTLAAEHGFDAAQTATLRTMGELLNYNSYGNTLSDLHFDPVVLYAALSEYGDPFAFVAAADAYTQLQAGYAEDIAAAATLRPYAENAQGVVYLLPNRAWARRVIGVWANALSQADQARAHLLLCPDGSGTYTVSLRAAQEAPQGAAAFCRQFAGGGGREAAAGITALPEARLAEVSTRFLSAFVRR